MATDLFRRTMAFNSGDAERDALMREVWTPVPWMVEVYTGRCGEVRENNILHWCYDAFGEQASPIHGRSGDWQRGHATVNGWTWFGFSSEALMQQFLGAWPQPDRVGAAPANLEEPRG
ncbi:hypothetical protein ACQR1Y_11925 [Bradyrhizobium sp. HKCCYLRH3099]|uniref:hypothetical protein n=1 Tax=unclassified Bradyrhizobium TaxID=2631580 RepID=UPI003EB8863E